MVRLSHLVIATRIREIPSDVENMIVETAVELISIASIVNAWYPCATVGVLDKFSSTKTKVRPTSPVPSLTLAATAVELISIASIVNAWYPCATLPHTSLL
jgi:hypothetical protein